MSKKWKGNTRSMKVMKLSQKKYGELLPPEFKGKMKKVGGKWIKEDSRKPERISYSQNWHAYNQYQTQEKLMFYRILNDAVNSLEIDERAYNGQVGRPYNLMKDMLKASCIKIFCNFSSRRIISELKLVQKLGYLKKVPHDSSIVRYFGSEEMEKYLSQLYQMLALPMKNIEKKFAVDSTGFSSSVKTDWLRIRLDRQNKEFRKWKKLHIVTGILTNIITSAEITKSYSHDSPLFKPLITDTAKVFEIGEVSADAGYLSNSNVQTVSRLGGTPYIMPKSNTKFTAMRGNRKWKEMIRLWKNNSEEFKRHYHLRSNVESTFSMMKRKFSTNLRSKKDQAQKNEILCKVVCHNISVLVSGIFEMGLELPWN